MNTEKKTKKIYRIALYGLSATGKTSVLAALAMPRYPHPLGYTCIWRDIELPSPNYGQLNQHLMTRHRSKEWMEQTILKLSQQKIPAPNPTGDNFIFEYDFTASTHQTFHIELVDYSGELINPNVNDRQHRKNMQKFTEMDGILVLAEAPFHDKLAHCGKPTDTDLYQLREAFSLLRCENQECAALDVPLALLVTKWDRYSNIDYPNPTNEQNKLKQFFNSNPPPPHQGLCDVLRFSVTKDNFKTFPVSALGASDCVQLDNGTFIETPKQVNPLNAFGLEDAFIWVAQRRDAIDLQNYQEQATFNLKKCKKTGLELLNRFPKGSEPAKQINTILQKCQKAKNVRAIYTFIAIIAFGVITETTIDLINYRQHKVGTNNPHATHEQLDKAEKWLTQYLAAPYFRHLISKLFLGRETVHTLLTKLQAHREKFLWEPVEKALYVNFQLAKTPALEYLKYYPYGQHAQEAQDIKLRAEILQQQQQDENTYRQIAQEMQEHKQSVEKLRNLLKKLRQTYPQTEKPELHQQRIALEKQLQEQLARQTLQQEWLQFREDFQQKMQAGKFLAAAQSLNSRQPDARLNELKETFKTIIIQDIEQQVTQAFKEQRLKFAYNLLKDYAKFPSQLQTPEGKLKIANLQNQVDEWQDRALYEAARQHREAYHIHRYMEQAPLQTMEKYVSVYETYLDNVSPNRTINQLQLKLAQIRWENLDDYDNIVRVFLNGKQVISNHKVDAKPNTSTAVIGISPFFTAKPNDLITIEVTVINEDIFFDDEYGQGRVKKQLSELANGYRLLLRNGYGVKTGTAFLEIEGYPKAPVLPAWRIF